MYCDNLMTVCITNASLIPRPPGSVDVGGHGDMLQLREHLGQDEEGDVFVGPVGGVGCDGCHVSVARLLNTVVHAVGQPLAVWQLEGGGVTTLSPDLAVTGPHPGPCLAPSRAQSSCSVPHHIEQPPAIRLLLARPTGCSRHPSHRAHLANVHIDGAVGDIDGEGVLPRLAGVGPHQWLQWQLAVGDLQQMLFTNVFSFTATLYISCQGYMWFGSICA